MSENIIQIPDSIVEYKIIEIKDEPDLKEAIEMSGISETELKETVKQILKSENDGGTNQGITPLTFVGDNYNYGYSPPTLVDEKDFPLVEHKPLEIPIGAGDGAFKAKQSNVRKALRDIQKSSNKKLKSYKKVINKLESLDNVEKNILKDAISVQEKIPKLQKMHERGINVDTNKIMNTVETFGVGSQNIVEGFKVQDDRNRLINRTDRDAVEHMYQFLNNGGGETIIDYTYTYEEMGLPVPIGEPLNYNSNFGNQFEARNSGAGSSYYMTRTRNQKACGSCWCFAMMALVEQIWFLNGGEKKSLSVQSGLDCNLHANFFFGDNYNVAGGGIARYVFSPTMNPTKAVRKKKMTKEEKIAMAKTEDGWDTCYHDGDPVRDCYKYSTTGGFRCKGYSVDAAITDLLADDPDGGIPSEDDYPYTAGYSFNGKKMDDRSEVSSGAEGGFSGLLDKAICKSSTYKSTGIKPHAYVNSLEYVSSEDGESDTGTYNLLKKHGAVVMTVKVEQDNTFRNCKGSIIDPLNEVLATTKLTKVPGSGGGGQTMYRDPSQKLRRLQHLITSQNPSSNWWSANHQVLIVGCGEVTEDYYDLRPNDKNRMPVGTKYWIVKNSHGNTWGEKYDGLNDGEAGYFRVRRYASNERINSPNMGPNGWINTEKRLRSRTPSGLEASRRNRSIINPVNLSENDYKTYIRTLFDWLGRCGPLGQLNCEASSVTVRRSMIPLIKKVPRPIGGCTDLGQLCEVSYQLSNGKTIEALEYQCPGDRKIGAKNLVGMCDRNPDGEGLYCKKLNINIDESLSRRTILGPDKDIFCSDYNNSDDYIEGMKRPSGLIEYEPHICYSKTSDGQIIENPNIGGSACTTHNCDDDPNGLLRALISMRAADTSDRTNYCDRRYCDYLSSNNLSKYCPDTCGLNITYTRDPRDGTVNHDDVIVCPKVQEISTFNPCERDEYWPEVKGSCNPATGRLPSDDTSIIKLGGGSTLTLEKVPTNCEGDWSEWSECMNVEGSNRRYKTRNFTIYKEAENGGENCKTPNGENLSHGQVEETIEGCEQIPDIVCGANSTIGDDKMSCVCNDGFIIDPQNENSCIIKEVVPDEIIPESKSCNEHSDCSMGQYCDNMKECYSCESLNNDWCDPIECSDGNNCPPEKCCNNQALQTQCNQFPDFGMRCEGVVVPDPPPRPPPRPSQTCDPSNCIYLDEDGNELSHPCEERFPVTDRSDAQMERCRMESFKTETVMDWKNPERITDEEREEWIWTKSTDFELPHPDNSLLESQEGIKKLNRKYGVIMIKRNLGRSRRYGWRAVRVPTSRDALRPPPRPSDKCTPKNCIYLDKDGNQLSHPCDESSRERCEMESFKTETVMDWTNPENITEEEREEWIMTKSTDFFIDHPDNSLLESREGLEKINRKYGVIMIKRNVGRSSMYDWRAVQVPAAPDAFGPVKEPDGKCEKHSDCVLGQYCDNFNDCYDCTSINKNWCDPIECKDGSNCPPEKCCNNQALLTQCNSSRFGIGDEFPDLRDRCEVASVASVDCVGSWSTWSPCSQECGGGEQTRSYSVTTEASGPGSATCSFDDGETETQSCNMQECSVDCEGYFTDYTQCYNFSHRGRDYRIRDRDYNIINPASGNGENCEYEERKYYELCAELTDANNQCVTNSTRSGGKCECNSGYVKTSDGRGGHTCEREKERERPWWEGFFR